AGGAAVSDGGAAAGGGASGCAGSARAGTIASSISAMRAMRAMRLNDHDGVAVRYENSSAGAAGEAAPCVTMRRIGRRHLHTLGVFPSPLWGRVRGGGGSWRTHLVQQQLPPSPTLPHKGGGSTPPVRKEAASTYLRVNPSPFIVRVLTISSPFPQSDRPCPFPCPAFSSLRSSRRWRRRCAPAASPTPARA